MLTQAFAAALGGAIARHFLDKLSRRGQIIAGGVAIILSIGIVAAATAFILQ